MGAQPRHLERESNDVCRMAQGSAAPQSPLEVWTPREMVPSRLLRLMMCQLSYVHGPIGGKQPGEATSRSVPRYTRLVDVYHRSPYKDGKEHDVREMYQIG
jgi:hypothetical protein